MKLLIATPLYPPEPGGPATYSHTLERGLPGKGFTVTVLPFNMVQHLPKGVRHLRYLLHVLALGRRADIILALDPVSVGLPARIAAGLLRKPFVVKVVGDYAWEQGRQRHGVWLPLDEFVRRKWVPLPSRLLRLVQTFVAKTAHSVLVPSQYLQSIVMTWGVPEKKISVIYNAVAAISPGELPTQVINIHGPVVLTVARLVPWKGIRGVIEALREVRAEVPDATLVIVGEGSEEENLKRHAARHLPEDAVVFTGRLDPAQTRAVIAQCDVFLLNSTYEGLSHVLIEAMSLSRPIIATKAGGNPELIADHETGLLVSVGDVRALARALLYLLQNPEQAQTLGKRAQERAGDFHEERMIEETAAYLRNIV